MPFSEHGGCWILTQIKHCATPPQLRRPRKPKNATLTIIKPLKWVLCIAVSLLCTALISNFKNSSLIEHQIWALWRRLVTHNKELSLPPPSKHSSKRSHKWAAPLSPSPRRGLLRRRCPGASPLESVQASNSRDNGPRMNSISAIFLKRKLFLEYSKKIRATRMPVPRIFGESHQAARCLNEFCLAGCVKYTKNGLLYRDRSFRTNLSCCNQK